MIALFRYNWLVRDEWLELCKKMPAEYLVSSRIGGVGSILYTLFHIIDVEYSWIRGIQDKSDIQIPFDDRMTLQRVKELSDAWRNEIKQFLHGWSSDWDNEYVTVSWSHERYTKGEILRHLIAHEIHHMGQLSIWARELGYEPISANVIGRGLL
ncbi:putative damage-inducible protein DinB [Paenibacillus castaneae]|uniref:DinB family protein n=1 Tax=Paenibacillus castaneae TaxID=474957 RepID=UPI000C9BCB5F|nr:DinB family protein [Paenibacillus castaneae]NIK76174.1 putative damage-inducible protein DinB [Paenibacillus castaneae]